MAAAFNEIIILPNPFPGKEKVWAWFFTVLPLDFGEVSCICHWYFLLMTLMTKIRGKFWLKNLLTVLNERTATSLGIAFRFGHPLCSWNVKGKAQSKSLWKSTKLLRANDEIYTALRGRSRECSETCWHNCLKDFVSIPSGCLLWIFLVTC